jgi:hypothetical protein
MAGSPQLTTDLQEMQKVKATEAGRRFSVRAFWWCVYQVSINKTRLRGQLVVSGFGCNAWTEGAVAGWDFRGQPKCPCSQPEALAPRRFEFVF